MRRDELTRTVKARGDGVFVAMGLNLLGQHGLKSGQLALAEGYFVKALEMRPKLHPAGHWRIDEARGMVGLARLRARRYDAAEADLIAAYEGLRAQRGPDAAETQAVKAHLVDISSGGINPSGLDSIAAAIAFVTPPFARPPVAR